MAIQLRPLPPEVFNEEARPYIKHLNVVLRDLCALEGTIRDPLQARRSDLSIARRNQFQVAVSRITPSISDVVSGISTVVGTPALTLGTVNTVGSTTTALSINSAIALFGTQVPSALAATAATGSSAYASRGDHVHLFPPTLRSTANASTLALTDDATDQTLTGSLGALNLNPVGAFTLNAGGGQTDFDLGQKTVVAASGLATLTASVSNVSNTATSLVIDSRSWFFVFTLSSLSRPPALATVV